jgi:hypothetical protein
MTVDYDDSVGVPSRGPRARFLHARPNAGMLDEYVEDPAGVWTRVASYTATELGTVAFYNTFNLTDDGLNVIYWASTTTGSGIYRASRTSVDEKLANPTPLPGLPRTVYDPYMTNDCSRVYFSGLNSVFVARQQ